MKIHFGIARLLELIADVFRSPNEKDGERLKKFLAGEQNRHQRFRG